jgi:hypothetical protein
MILKSAKEKQQIASYILMNFAHTLFTSVASVTIENQVNKQG